MPLAAVARATLPSAWTLLRMWHNNFFFFSFTWRRIQTQRLSAPCYFASFCVLCVFFLFFWNTHATVAHLQSPRPDKNWLSGKNINHRCLRTNPQHPTGDSETTGQPMDCYGVQQALEAVQGEEAETRMPGRTTKSA